MPISVKLYRIEFGCCSSNAAVSGDYSLFLSIYITRNKICIYIKILAPVINFKK
jgi:hypothetical protein